MFAWTADRLQPSEPGRSVVYVYCLHYLGGSAREWAAVEAQLPSFIRLVAVDLPGFGDAANSTEFTVAEMATAVAHLIGTQRPELWMLVGHSMGAKVLTALARRVEDDGEALPGLKGLLTLAGSPPSPEPMDEEQRHLLMGMFRGDAASSRREAARFIHENLGRAVDASSVEQAVDDVLRGSRAAWQAWLGSGSREDCAQTVGRLHTPTVIVAGALDPKLGPDAQRRLMAPHFAESRLEVLPGAKHLLPIECAAEVAELILQHALSVTASVRVPG